MAAVQMPKLEEQLLLSLLPRDEADQRDIVLEVIGYLLKSFLVTCVSLSLCPLACAVIGSWSVLLCLGA